MEEKASVAELLLICMHQLPPQYTLALVSRSDPSYRGQLGEGTEGPRGRGQGG
jgi:hypothetical protein